VGVAVAGGEILASVGEDTIKGVPAGNISAGAELARSAYAGMRNQAMSLVLEWYQCRLEHSIRVDGGADVEDRVGAMRAAIVEVDSQLILAQAASERSFADFTGFINGLGTTGRPPEAYTLAPAKFDQYFADVDAQQTWIRTTTVRGWITGGPRGVRITACGGIIMAALSDGGSSIQASVSGVQAALKNYFTASMTPRVGLLQMARGYAASPVSLTPTEAGTFQGCAASLLQSQQEPQPLPGRAGAGSTAASGAAPASASGQGPAAGQTPAGPPAATTPLGR
jgi:hypothetical protein